MSKTPVVYVCMRNRINSFDITPESFIPLEEQFPAFSYRYFDSRSLMFEKLADADIVITWSFPARYYKKAKKLKAVFTPSAGNDWVDKDPTGKVNVYYGTFHGKMIAESLLGMMYMFNNHYLGMEQCRLQKRWDANQQTGRTLLANTSVLLIGYGNIGRYCGKLLQPLVGNITGVKRSINQPYDNLGIELIDFSNLSDKLPEADHVVLLLPGNDQTEGIIHKEHFEKMKSSAILYNFGRGKVINETDLIAALQTGEIAGAGLDVFEEEPLPTSSPIWELPNVFITPHSSCCYQDYARLFVDELTNRIKKLYRT